MAFSNRFRLVRAADQLVVDVQLDGIDAFPHRRPARLGAASDRQRGAHPPAVRPPAGARERRAAVVIKARQFTGDTRFRRVDDRPVSASPFREYFKPLREGDRSAQRDGAAVSVEILNRALPPSPDIHSVLPTRRLTRGTSAITRTRPHETPRRAGVAAPAVASDRRGRAARRGHR